MVALGGDSAKNPEEEEYDYDNDDAAAWYAAAAAGGSDDEGDAAADVEGDPYLQAIDDPYAVDVPAADAAAGTEDESAGRAQKPADGTVAPDAATSQAAAPQAAAAVALAAAFAAPAAPTEVEPSSAVVEPPRKVQKTEATLVPAAAPPVAPPAPPPAAATAAATAAGTAPAKEAEAAVAQGSAEEVAEVAHTTLQEAGLSEPVPDVDALEAGHSFEDEAWDERVVAVRQGQVFIELQHCNPPMGDEQFKRFCDWLDQQMPMVTSNFPYVRRSGANVDLSDNVIGPEGLDKLFRVLRDHRVPCVVMKAYRNCLDDSIVDTLIEYLYTQPESFPMHGIHISHNNISDKGALRLIRAAASCGHYPRYTSRLPLWLRLECNRIASPQKVLADCLEEGYNVCLMGNGLCSRPDCNHYSNVHVQLPYFTHQAAGSGDMPAQRVKSQPGTAFQAKSEDTSATPQLVPMMATPNMMGTPPPPPPPAQFGASPVIMAPPVMYGEPGAQPKSGCGGYWAGAADPSWKGGGGGWKGGGGCGYKGGWGKGNGTAKGAQALPGSGGGKGRGGGWNRQMWQGQSLVSKAKKDAKLLEGEVMLGFSWQFVGDGHAPRITAIDGASSASLVAQAGDSLLRVNGLDTKMFSEKQLTDMLKQRPISLRFGDE